MLEHSENQRKWLQWLQAAIAGGHIISIPFATFDQAEVVARGAFGEVSRAYWKSAEKTVALKSLYSNPVMGTEGSFEEFVKELKLIRSVDFHDNVIRFYGVSEDPSTQRYFMVLQYANGGNLRDFLNKNHELLNWESKINMASQIASGLKCIHERNIVHRDLHSKNILVNDGKLMITDFGLSKSLDNNEASVVGGMAGYIEPQCFVDSTYKRDKASDIYSLGVLLWEISSGRPPFNNMTILDIAREVVHGTREAPIEGSPPAYVSIYQMAWDNDPRRRPTINKVREDLERLQSNGDIENFSLAGLSINSQVTPNANNNNSPGFQGNHTTPYQQTPQSQSYQQQPPQSQSYQQQPPQSQPYQQQPPQPPQSQPYQQQPPQPQSQPYQQQPPQPPQPQPYQQQPPQPQPYQQQPRPYQQQPQPPQPPQPSQPSQPSQPPQPPQPPQPRPYQQPPPQPRPYQQQPPQPRLFQQQPPQPLPYQQQPPQTRPYQQQPPQPRPYQQPQPQPYQQRPPQPQPYRQPYQQPQQQSQQQQTQHHSNQFPLNYNNNMQSNPIAQQQNHTLHNFPGVQNQISQHHSNQYHPGVQNQPGLQRSSTMRQQQYPQNLNQISNQPSSQPFNTYNNSYSHHPPQRPTVHPSQNPHKCTCADILTKYVEEYQNIRGYVEPDGCHAGYHAGMGDIVGLRWHLYHDRRIEGNYNFSDMSDKLVLITARFCGRKNLNIMFQCLKEYGAMFDVTTRKKAYTPFHLLFFNKELSNKITYSPEKLERYHKVLFQAIKFLKEAGCSINAKDEDGKTILSYFLEEKFLHQERSPIIQAILDNGADPNIPITIKDWGEFDAKTALLQAVKNKWPTSVLELIVKHGVDVKAVNNEGMNALAIATQAKDILTMTWLLENISIISDHDSIKIAKKFSGNFTSKESQLLSKKRNKVLPNDLSSFSSTSSSSSNVNSNNSNVNSNVNNASKKK